MAAMRFGSPEERALYQAHQKLGLEEGRQFSYHPGETLPFVELDLNTALGFGADDFTRSLAEAQGLTVTDLAPVASLNAALSALRRVRAGALPAQSLSGRRAAGVGHTMETSAPFAGRFVNSMTTRLTAVDKNAFSSQFQPFSISFWIKFNSFNDAADYRYFIVGKSKGVYSLNPSPIIPENEYAVCLRVANGIPTTLELRVDRQQTGVQGVYQLGIGDIDIGGALSYDGTGQILTPVTITTGVWYFITAVLDLSHQPAEHLVQIRIFIDNGYVQSRTTNFTALIPWDNGYNFHIGGQEGTAWVPPESFPIAHNVDADIDMLGVWVNRTLSLSDVLTLYNGGNGLRGSDLSAGLLTNLVDWYDFSEHDGARRGLSGGHALTDVNSNVVRVAGKT